MWRRASKCWLSRNTGSSVPVQYKKVILNEPKVQHIGFTDSRTAEPGVVEKKVYRNLNVTVMRLYIIDECNPTKWHNRWTKMDRVSSVCYWKETPAWPHSWRWHTVSILKWFFLQIPPGLVRFSSGCTWRSLTSLLETWACTNIFTLSIYSLLPSLYVIYFVWLVKFHFTRVCLCFVVLYRTCLIPLILLPTAVLCLFGNPTPGLLFLLSFSSYNTTHTRKTHTRRVIWLKCNNRHVELYHAGAGTPAFRT